MMFVICFDCLDFPNQFPYVTTKSKILTVTPSSCLDCSDFSPKIKTNQNKANINEICIRTTIYTNLRNLNFNLHFSCDVSMYTYNVFSTSLQRP